MNEAQWRTFVCERLEEGDVKMGSMEHSIQENTALTIDLKDDTKEMLEAFQAMKGGFKVLEWLGRIAKIVAAIGAAVAICWRAYNGNWLGK